MAFMWAALGVALLHGLMPGHWLPYVAAARAQCWTPFRPGGVTTMDPLTIAGVVVAGKAKGAVGTIAHSRVAVRGPVGVCCGA